MPDRASTVSMVLERYMYACEYDEHEREHDARTYMCMQVNCIEQFWTTLWRWSETVRDQAQNKTKMAYERHCQALQTLMLLSEHPPIRYDSHPL